MSNEDLMKILNVPTIQGPIDKRLRETFLRKPMVYALCNNNNNNNNNLFAQRPHLNDDALFASEEDADDDDDEDEELKEEEELVKQSSLPLKMQNISPMINSLTKNSLTKKSSLPTLKEVSSRDSSKTRSLKRSLPTLTSSKYISPDDSRDSFEPVTKQHFRTSLSLRGGKKMERLGKIEKITKKGKHKKTKKTTRISTFLRQLKFI
jgi:hypothetical protein